MPTASVVAPGAQKCLYNAHVRIVRGFSSLTGGQDRFGWLDGRTRGACASGCATCPLGECEAGSQTSCVSKQLTSARYLIQKLSDAAGRLTAEELCDS